MRIGSVLLLSWLLVAPGCARRVVDRVDNDESMRAEIVRLVPIGTPIEEASSRLAQEGLACARTALQEFADRGRLTYARCEGRSSGMFTFRVWKIALVDSAGRVADVLVSSGFTGL
jgi:hypothetical protein